MGFGRAILSSLKKYVGFRGRASRAEYWFFTLFFLLMVGGFLALDTRTGIIGKDFASRSPAGHVLTALLLGTIPPYLAVTVRRLHDIGMSGWWYMLNFVPLGSLAVFAFTLVRGTRGPNQYGPDPYDDIADVFN